MATEALVAGETTGGGVDPDLRRFSAEGEIGTIGLCGTTLETREGAAGVEVTPAPERESTLPSQRALNASLKEYFESSQSLEPSRTGVAGAAREASGPRAFRVGDTVSRVSADTVFSASRWSSLSKTVSAGLGVALVLGVSLAGLWVWSELEPGGGLGAGLPPLPASARVPPASDTALAGTDGPAPAPADPAPVLSALAVPAAAAPEPHAADTPKEQYKKRGPLAELPAIDPPALEPDAFSERAPLSSPGLKPAPTSEVSPSELDPEATRRTATAQDDSPAPWESENYKYKDSPEATGAPRLAPPNAPPSAIRIRRSPPRDRLDPELSEAYRAFQSGNPSRAETLYRRVQAREPDRRDALLGLAAVAMRQGRAPEAYGYYRRLIELDPRDSVALAGIASLTGSGGREANESRLKLLLDQSPGASHLHFALGNLYAKQGRWAEAQGAYFKAYTSDSKNPDYSFNLAVSLDRLGQGRAALGYYRRALDAADRGVKGFDTAQVLTRIQALSSQSSNP
ncbi:MAG: tetratricopeptide repeat protein [Pseudomonadota bacterium]|nr:tetratricopeptide repeat protein [Gammaproteobacteria bacterium]MDQ3581024.1 tetratricopeptide repeat protein [Pseudomonadota bacterium]